MTDSSLRSVGEGLFGKPFHDLRRRATSAVVLGLLALVATYAGGLAFMVLVLIAGVLMSWEWGRIVRRDGVDSSFWLHAGAVAAAVMLATAGQSLFAIIVLLIGAMIVPTSTFGGVALLSSLGVLYVGIPATALIVLRADASHGVVAVLFVLLVVWTFDTAAFVGGRSIGGPKLWPSISPNKTWAGFICGILAGALSGACFAVWLGAPLAHLLLVSLSLAAVSQGGDLVESALKREFGVKDSSGLIPGHGGVLDRLDGIVAAATLAGLIGIVANIAAPARALLFGS